MNSPVKNLLLWFDAEKSLLRITIWLLVLPLCFWILKSFLIIVFSDFWTTLYTLSNSCWDCILMSGCQYCHNVYICSSSCNRIMLYNRWRKWICILFSFIVVGYPTFFLFLLCLKQKHTHINTRLFWLCFLFSMRTWWSSRASAVLSVCPTPVCLLENSTR